MPELLPEQPVPNLLHVRQALLSAVTMLAIHGLLNLRKSMGALCVPPLQTLHVRVPLATCEATAGQQTDRGVCYLCMMISNSRTLAASAALARCAAARLALLDMRARCSLLELQSSRVQLHLLCSLVDAKLSCSREAWSCSRPPWPYSARG